MGRVRATLPIHLLKIFILRGVGGGGVRGGGRWGGSGLTIYYILYCMGTATTSVVV